MAYIEGCLFVLDGLYYEHSVIGKILALYGNVCLLNFPVHYR